MADPHSLKSTGARVVSAGTAVPFPAGESKELIVRADPDNTGVCVIGGSDVVAASGTTRFGYPLRKNEGVTIRADRLNHITVFVDSTVNDDKVIGFYVPIG